MDRRDYLRSVGGGCAAGLVAVAGCLSTDVLDRFTDAETPGATAGDGTQSPESIGTGIPESRLTVPDFREVRRDVGEPVAAFDDLESWETTAGETAVDSEHASRSSESLRLVVGSGTDHATARYDFPEPRDFRGRIFSIAVKWQHYSSHYAEVWLSLYDESGDYIQFNQVLQWEYLQEWHRLDMGIREIGGEPAFDAVTGMEVTTWAGDGRSHAWVADARTTQMDAEGRVLLTFDDSRASQYSVAFPIMEEYGFPGAVGVITGTLGEGAYASVEQLGKMYDAGWDMCSHPQFPDRPLTEFGADELDGTLRDYKRWLLSRGFERGADCIIYPFGHIDDRGLDVVARYYKLGLKVTGQTPYGRAVSSPLLAGRVPGEQVDAVKRAVTLAGEYGLVVPVMYHAIDVENRVSKRGFEQTLQHVDRTENVSVTTPSEWLGRLEVGPG